MTGPIFEMDVGPNDFSLEHTLSAVENIRCGIERVVACNPDTVMPFVWIEGPSTALDEIEARWKLTKQLKRLPASRSLKENASIR